MAKTAADVMSRCGDLRTYWAPRNEKFKEWYRLIEMIDELKTEKMESFVGNDPRAMFNLILHLLDSPIPHRYQNVDLMDNEQSEAASVVSDLLDVGWEDNENRFRMSGPHQSMKRYTISLLLATGWYAKFAAVTDDGTRFWAETWNPAEVFPMWNDFGLCEVAHIFSMEGKQALRLCQRYGWKLNRAKLSECTVYDYWWMEYDDMWPVCWNAIVIDGVLVKCEPTRFQKIPIYTAPVGGLPDMGPLTDSNAEGGRTFTAGARASKERWKSEIGQSVVATNENVYRTWNKWWTYGLQLLRDVAQPAVLERSQSGKPIVKPENIFKRGTVYRLGPNDDVDYLSPPPVPLELRSSQLDLEAMMQRGGVSWAMYGNIQGQLSAYVMSQIAASANQIIKPFHQAIINLYSDIDNDWIDDTVERNLRPYDIKIPSKLPKNQRISAHYDIEIPGDLVQRATVARMLHPEFKLSYRYVVQKLFPDIKDQLRERAQLRSDEAANNPINAAIAYIQYCRRQARYLERNHDLEGAKLYELAGQAALQMIAPPAPAGPALPTGGGMQGVRPEVVPPPAPPVETPI